MKRKKAKKRKKNLAEKNYKKFKKLRKLSDEDKEELFERLENAVDCRWQSYGPEGDNWVKICPDRPWLYATCKTHVEIEPGVRFVPDYAFFSVEVPAMEFELMTDKLDWDTCWDVLKKYVREK